jgi:glycosyltransferase involved in cell wall biosynthesis
MKILIVCEYFPESDTVDITGGVEALSFYISRELRKDATVEILSNGSGNAWSDASLRSIPSRLKFFLRVLWLAARSDADVIVGMTYVVYGAAWIIGKLRRKAVVFWYHDVLIGRWRAGGFGKIAGLVGEVVERVTLKLPGVQYIAISQVTANKLMQHGINHDQIKVIGCGVDLETIATRVGSFARKSTVIVVGRLVPYKRVDLVIRAFQRVAYQFPDTTLQIIGQGPERERLEQMAKELGIEHRISFEGFVESHLEVLERIKASKVLVTASEIEGFGIVLLEAMALGVPYVATRIPAFEESSGNGTGGVLVEVGNCDEFALAIGRVIGDPEYADTLRERGLSRAQLFGWGAMAKQARELFDSLVVSQRR